MKSNLNFTLTGNRLLPIWIAFIFFFMLPIHLLLEQITEVNSSDIPAEGPSKIIFLYFAVVLTMGFVFVFSLAKLGIQSIELKGMKLVCDYSWERFLKITLLGLLFSFITFGIYVPWFIKNIHCYFVGHSIYNAHRFSFMGTGSRLFLIMSLTIFIPFLVVGIVLFSILDSEIDLWIYQLIVMFSLIPNLYLTFKWMVDIRYKEYLISSTTRFFPAVGKIAVELLLAVILVFILVFIFRFFASVFKDIWWITEFFPAVGKNAINSVLAVITFGIYFPMAFIRLYRYFAEHTKSNVVDGKQITMGYGGDLRADFIFIWGQILLTVVTFGIYGPWAFTVVLQRVVNQTFVTTDSVSVG